MLEHLVPRIGAGHADGRLALLQQWRLTVLMLATATRRAGARTPARPTALSEVQSPALWRSLKPPAGAMAERAWQLALRDQPVWLSNHGLRTHAWAQAMGLLADHQFDAEALFAAALLHDSGLTDTAASPPQHCFALRSARFARQALAGVGTPARVQLVAEAIARHLDFQVHLRDGVEAHLLQAGALLDVTGRGLSRVPVDLRHQVLAAHPRAGMKEGLCQCMGRVAQQAPGTRASLYVRRFGFLDLIRSAPFDS